MIYLLPEGYNRERLDQELSGEFGYFAEDAEEVSLSVFDTFDWRLYQQNLACYLAGSRLKLINLSSGDSVQSLAVTAAPVFAGDLPESELKRTLEPILEMRALLTLGEVKIVSVSYRILNREEKTVARLIFGEIGHRGDGNPSQTIAFVQLKGVRGYPRYLRAAENFCKAAGFGTSSPMGLYRLAMEAGGKVPGDYSNKLTFQLAPEMRSDEAAKVILRFLLGVMRQNEDGIRKDIDTEFLHDFRVAVRRTRSALTQIKDVYPSEITERFKADFSLIGGFTNRLRDMDVYLLNEGAYRAMLPETLQKNIQPLFTYLRGKRAEALVEVLDGLDSKEYARILHDWETFLDTPLPDAEAAPGAARPVIELASQRIYKRYRTVNKGGKEILNNEEDHLLHALRIECKKLRYLMEFFTSLYPRKKIAILIKQLKVLQDNLGDINDLSIQEGHLLNISGELPMRDAAARQTLVGIGSLVEALDRRKIAVKGEFARAFTRFASTENRELFKELFKEYREEKLEGRS